MTALIPLADLSVSQLDRLALLHVETMHTLLSDMGLPFVRRYYEIARRDPAVIGLCAVDGGDPCGYAVGTPDPGRLFAGLKSPPYWFAARLVRLVVVRPAVVAQLAVSTLRSTRHAVPPGSIELTYIGVSPAARGRGLGGQLLADFRRAALAAGHTAVALSVEADNAAAVALYDKAGFRTVDRFREGRFVRQRMECLLREFSPAVKDIP